MRPRLAVVVKYYRPLERISGVVNLLAALAPRLADATDLHVVTWRPRGDDRDHLVLDGAEVHRVRAPFPANAHRVLRRLRPDATLVVSGIYDLGKALAYFAPCRVARHGGKVAFYQATNTSGPAPRRVGRFARAYDVVLAASEEPASHLGAVVPSPVEVVPPGIDLDALGRVVPEAKQRAHRVGFVNHLNTVKGADLAAAAFAELAEKRDDIEFVVAGTGDLASELRERHGAHPAIELRGYLGEAERLALLASLDVAVFPFRTAVSVLGVSQTVLECMALGAVVVGSRSGSIAPAVRDGVDGHLFDDPDEMIQHVEQLLDDPEHRIARRDSARGHVERYDVRATAARLLDRLGIARHGVQ
jgi:glycosyltransferase involved in cell wall biosynthesis